MLAVEANDQYWIPGIHGGRREIAPSSCPVTSTLMLWCAYNCLHECVHVHVHMHTHIHERDRETDRDKDTHTQTHRHTLKRLKGATVNLDSGGVLLTNVKYLPTGKHAMKDTKHVIMNLFLKSDTFSRAMDWS